MAALIAFSRLYFFVHYPTDILGGILLGTLDALLAVWLVKHLENRADAQSASNADKTEHVQENKITGQKPGSDRKGKNFDEQQNVME